MEVLQAQNISPRKRGRPKKQPVVPVGREQQKALFLQKLVEYGRVTLAVRESGVASSQYYKLREENYISDDEVNFAILQHVDNIYHAALEWGLKGIPVPIRDQHGRIIANPDGTSVTEYRRSEKIFLKLLDADPAFRKHIQEVMRTGNGYTQTLGGYTIVDADAGDIANTVLHIKLADYTYAGREILIEALKAAESYKSTE